jgi:hypothetical protein
MSPSRNEPCPCGSGRKYKSCHYARDRAAAAQAEAAAAVAAAPVAARVAALEACVEHLTFRLLRFARARYGADWFMDVLQREGVLQDGTAPDAETKLILLWLTQYRVDSTGLTLVETWRRHQHSPVSKDEQLILDAFANAWLSVWEIAEVQPGTGVKMVDLLTLEERFVCDVRLSQVMEKFCAMLALVLTCDGVSFMGAMYAQPLFAVQVEVVAGAARRLCGVSTGAVSPAKLRGSRLQLDLLKLWREQVEDFLNLPNTMFQDADGNPLTFTKDEYDLVAPDHVVAGVLGLLPGVHEIEGEPGSRVFIQGEGEVQLTLSATQLVMQSAWARRNDEMRALIEAQLPGGVRFRVRSEEDIAQILREAIEFGADPERAPNRVEPLSPEEAAIFRAEHMRQLLDWLDDENSVLDGLTPRQAARRPELRAQLAALLKDLEMDEVALPPDQRIDLRWLQKELDISL